MHRKDLLSVHDQHAQTMLDVKYFDQSLIIAEQSQLEAHSFSEISVSL